MTNKEYWHKRETEHIKKQVLSEKELTRQIEAKYKELRITIQRQINQFMSSYAGKEQISIAEAHKRASTMDIEAFASKAKKYVEAKDFSPAANKELRLYNLTMKVNRLELLKSEIGLELVKFHAELDKLYGGELTETARKEFMRQAGILGQTIFDNQKAINQIVTASYQNANFSERIWMYQNDLKHELGKILTRALVQGKNPNEFIRLLRNLFDVSTQNALNLLITEIGRVQIEVQRALYEKYGYKRYLYIAEPTACAKCAPLNNKDFAVKDMMPGTNSPMMHPRCKCSTAAFMDRSELDEIFDRVD